MKTFDERTGDVLKKVRIIKRNRAIAVALCLCIVCAVAAPVLFMPYDTTPPDVSMYADSPYYDLIQKLNEMTFVKPEYKNNFEKWSADVEENLDFAVGDNMAPGTVWDESGVPENGTNGSYVEVTDNQTHGVIEGDLIKRTDKYIFYWSAVGVNIYSVNKDESELVGKFSVTFPEDRQIRVDNFLREMYLSQDGNRLTLMLSVFGDVHEKGVKETALCLVSFDVSDVTDVKEAGRLYLNGSYLSSRKVGGTFLLMSNFRINRNTLDFDDPVTFLPACGAAGEMEPVAADRIIYPEDPGNLKYTVVTVIEESTLTALDSVAFLSYSEQLYVSADTIYATRSFIQQSETEQYQIRDTMTQITGVTYTGGELRIAGTVSLPGSVKNQYSLDAYDGILRVVTSTNRNYSQERTYNGNSYMATVRRDQNVDLYCVALEDWSVAAKVIGFAPAGETAESVRFDGHTAYVCTAKVITLTDPVYYFDLSDLSNITWKDTGVIAGYSSSLVNFGDYLLGIGFGGTGGLKVEVYQETPTGVTSVASYEQQASFPPEYKSYLIDRDMQTVGLGIKDGKSGKEYYIVLGFDGYQLTELARIPMDTACTVNTRAVLDDGWLYLFGHWNEFITEKLW